MSNHDAFEVKRVRDAGAIIIAKSNMAEFVRGPGDFGPPAM
jgi:Asp-tRNA(Asn)/Glu-tRNA(Gln) amidotransferase A subunit family amidase